jgi:type IV secretion system protein VirD4
MELDKRQLARWGITLALCALGTNGEAQSLFGGNRYYGGYDYSVISGLIRLAMIGLSTATGFVIGWFFSPGARELRQAIYLLLGAVGLGIVLLSNGGLSWSLASLMAMIGFFWGIGYWLGRSVRSLMEIPTTFGSAKWADAQHMHDNDLFGMDGILLGRAHDGKQQRVISYKGDRH